MVRMALAMLAGLVLLGCTETEFVKANTTEDQYRRDAAACRRQVNSQMARDRNIDADIATTVGTQSQQVRPGSSQVRQQMATRGDVVRSDRLMESCMRARGYSGAGDAPQPKPPADQKP